MNTRTRPQRITVGVDGSIESHAALLWAVDNAQPGDTVHVVYCWKPSPIIVGLEDGLDCEQGAQRLVDRFVAKGQYLIADREIGVTGEIRRGRPRERLAESPIDLLVVGAGHHGLVSNTLGGSTTTYLVRHAGVPVVVVPDHRRRAVIGAAAEQLGERV